MPHAPFGGYQTCGIGRQGGRHNAFTEVKTVTIRLGG